MANMTHGHGFFRRQMFSRHHAAEPGERHWGWLMALGVLFVVLGTIGLTMAVMMTLASIFVLGILVLAGGAMQVVQGVSFRGYKGKGWHLLIGFLYIVAAWVIISDPLVASTILTMLLAWVLVFIGLFRIFLAIQNRLRARWVWPLTAGFLSVLVGLMILLQWPMTGLWVIGLFVSVELIIHGWGYIALSLAEKHIRK